MFPRLSVLALAAAALLSVPSLSEAQVVVGPGYCAPGYPGVYGGGYVTNYPGSFYGPGWYAAPGMNGYPPLGIGGGVNYSGTTPYPIFRADWAGGPISFVTPNVVLPAVTPKSTPPATTPPTANPTPPATIPSPAINPPPPAPAPVPQPLPKAPKTDDRPE